ncbi:MAG: ABC transporter ATP-binding protein [Lachnospiraceae bacterium]|nr:ABC transporter ATP-binding protein [Lachnospiraceae bacterium]
MDNIIELQNVSFGYGKESILHDINFIVKRQEYVGIIGANGAGKSTLMKLILGQLVPDGGTIAVNTGRIGYVPQVGFSGAANFPANVEEVVMTGLYAELGMFHLPKKEHRKKVADTLGLVGMQDYRKRMLSELSGGQQQRVMIAKALISSPELLVLDEPLTGIDKEAGQKLYELLSRFNNEYGMTIVMVTHNMEQVSRYTDRFYHVSNGSVHPDKSSILCDEVLKDKMIITKPNRYKKHNNESKKVPKEEPYDASYKGKRKNKETVCEEQVASREKTFGKGREDGTAKKEDTTC